MGFITVCSSPCQAVEQHPLANPCPHCPVVPNCQLAAAEVLEQAGLVEVEQDASDHPGCAGQQTDSTHTINTQSTGQCVRNSVSM